MSGELRYNQPEKGTTDWHIPLNENFGEIEIDMEAVEAATAALADEKADAAEVTDALAGKADTAHDHEGDTLAPAGLNGDLVARDEPVTNISGNIYYVPEGSGDPTEADGDLVFYYDAS